MDCFVGLWRGFFLFFVFCWHDLGFRVTVSFQGLGGVVKGLGCRVAVWIRWIAFSGLTVGGVV